MSQGPRDTINMEDQFHTRTDDDLFVDDDFEPVDGEAMPSIEPKTVLESYIESQQIPAPEEPAPMVTDDKSAPLARRKPGKSLANSRFASMPDEEPKAEPPKPDTKKEKEPRQRGKRQPKQQQAQKVASGEDAATADPADPADTTPALASSGIQIKGRAKAEKAKAEQSRVEKGKGEKPKSDKPRQENKQPGNRKKSDADDAATEAKPKREKRPDTRSMSGANPRSKLTEDEISAKMQKMKVVSEEKSRQFDKATQDEKQHNEAYAKVIAKNLEEARKRREQEQAVQHKADEERKELEAERAKNRERKRRAMNNKEGSWDDRKQNAIDAEQRQTFRGANGGIRGGRGGSGLGSSRFSADGAQGDRRGSGRREGNGQKEAERTEPKPLLKIEDFPALPEFEPGGNWGDEMEEFDEMNKTKTSTT